LPLIWMPRAVMLRACGVDHPSWQALVTVHPMFWRDGMVDFVRLVSTGTIVLERGSDVALPSRTKPRRVLLRLSHGLPRQQESLGAAETIAVDACRCRQAQ
jgi:hypothetical protein